MTDHAAYAVFLHPQAIEALGAAIQPYLLDSPAGAHLQCAEIDSGGALFEMTLIGRNAEGRAVEVELMIPVAMIKLVISVRREGEFGFGPRDATEIVAPTEEPTSSTPAASTEDESHDTPGNGPAPATVAPGAAST
jgi:hypothetical protein